MKPSQFIESRTKFYLTNRPAGASPFNQALLDYLDLEWKEKHQNHTNAGMSCKECREYNF